MRDRMPVPGLWSCATREIVSMLSKILPLAIAGAASLTAFSASAQNLSPSFTQTCAYRNGPRAGQTIDYTGTPGAVSVPIGSRCADMQGSSGAAVSSAPGRGATNRFYMSPGAPAAWGSGGAVSPGFSLTCRFDSGPRAGTSTNFSGTLGAQPVAIGNACSDGASSGLAVASGQ
jgi:hypothetical protein